MNFLIRHRKEVLLSAAALVLIGGILLVGQKTQAPEEAAQVVGNNATSTEEVGGSTSTASAPQPTVLTYTQAVNKYKDRRIQFDANCVMLPNPASFRNNTTIMLDNRSPKARSVFLNRVEYKLSGYGFKTVTLSYSGLPKTVVVDCGTGRNTGTILVQQ